jgi:hypothetical protein
MYLNQCCDELVQNICPQQLCFCEYALDNSLDTLHFKLLHLNQKN